MKAVALAVLALLAGALPSQAGAQGAPIGEDAAVCAGNTGPAVRVNVIGLKDRTGRLKLELYPGNEDDFLKDDRDLKKEGKFFRRVWVDTPPEGNVVLCIRAPRPGRYALFFTHDRDGKNKFNIWKDGAGFPSNEKLGRSRPRLRQSLVDIGNGVTNTTIQVQYLRGIFAGFGPIG